MSDGVLRLAVYCGSNGGSDMRFAQDARALGQAIVGRGAERGAPPPVCRPKTSPGLP